MTDLGGISELQARLAELDARVASLEASRSSARPPVEVAAGELDTELLRRLRQRSAPEFRDDVSSGSVLYAGSADVADGSYVWQMERPVPGLLGISDELIATIGAALSNPGRVRLLKAVLRGSAEIAALQSALGQVSTGQLYHHLKELTAAGLVVQHSRGHYTVPPHAVVPLLALFAAAFDLHAAPSVAVEGNQT